MHATGGYSRRWSRPFSAGGVHVVAIPIDYSENMRVLVDELTNSVPPRPRRSRAEVLHLHEQQDERQRNAVDHPLGKNHVAERKACDAEAGWK